MRDFWRMIYNDPGLAFWLAFVGCAILACLALAGWTLAGGGS